MDLPHADTDEPVIGLDLICGRAAPPRTEPFSEAITATADQQHTTPARQHRATARQRTNDKPQGNGFESCIIAWLLRTALECTAKQVATRDQNSKSFCSASAALLSAKPA